MAARPLRSVVLLLVALFACSCDDSPASSDALVDGQTTDVDRDTSGVPDLGPDSSDTEHDVAPDVEQDLPLDQDLLVDTAIETDGDVLLDETASELVDQADDFADVDADIYVGVSCAVGAAQGTCQHVADCVGVSTSGFCPGPADIQCCTEPSTVVPCAVQGRPGVCISTADCASPQVSTAGLCPGAADIQCCTDPPTTNTCDPATHVYPDSTLVDGSGEQSCPAGMVAVAGTFCVDRYEAALLEVLSDGSTTPWSPYFNPGATRVRAVSSAAVVPQGYITGVQAAAACVEAGKRLCNDTEWLRACQGSQGTTYPYGNTRTWGVCNDSRSPHPVIEYFGTSAAWIWSELGNACINQLPNSLDRTGDNPGCITEDGAYDMMGNLHEWTSDPAGTFRGGFYVDTVINGQGCLYRTTAHNNQHWDYSTGFRCCADIQ